MYKAISLFHFFVSVSCKLAICVITLFFLVDKVLQHWFEGMYVVSTLCTPNLKSTVHINSKMRMLHNALNPLQKLCIQIQIQPRWHISFFPIGS